MSAEVMSDAEKRAIEHRWDGYVLTDRRGRSWTPAIAKRFEALYPNDNLHVRGVWGGFCYRINCSLESQGWACLVDVAEFIENWRRERGSFRGAVAKAQGVLEMVPDLTELTVGNVRMGVVDGRLVDWRCHEVAPPESDTPI